MARLRATTMPPTPSRAPQLVIVVPPLVVDDQGVPDWRAIDAVVEGDRAAPHPMACACRSRRPCPSATTRDRIAPRLEELSEWSSAWS